MPQLAAVFVGGVELCHCASALDIDGVLRTTGELPLRGVRHQPQSKEHNIPVYRQSGQQCRVGMPRGRGGLIHCGGVAGGREQLCGGKQHQVCGQRCSALGVLLVRLVHPAEQE